MDRSDLMEMMPNEKKESEDRPGNEAKRGERNRLERPTRQTKPGQNGTSNRADDQESAREIPDALNDPETGEKMRDSERSESGSAPPHGKYRLLLRSVMTCLSSNAVLCALVAGYGLLGAFVFQTLEAEYEVVVRERGARLRSQTLASMYNATAQMNLLKEGNWTAEMTVLLRQYEEALLTTASREGFDGLDPDSDDRKWSFSAALFFSVAVMTTIGYSHVNPHTARGKVVTMVYAGFGIPLTLFCVTKVATTLADALFSAYGRCERRRAASRKEQRHAAVDATGEEAKAPKRFPVSLVLFLLLGYACGGALLFSLWEGWLFIDGLYFCFDTLSTIGFGDILPGRAVSHEVTFVEQAKIVAGCLYLLFGLTMVVMSFELVQAEVNAKVKELGAFIGFVDEEKRESRSDKK